MGTEATGKAMTVAMNKKAAGKAKLEDAMRELKEKQAAAATKRYAAKEKASKKKELEIELKENLKSMRSEKRSLTPLTSAKKHRKIQECELAAARKKAEIAKAKLEQAKAEQEAARVEAEAIAAREEAKRVLEELKEVKSEVLQMKASNKKKTAKLKMANAASGVENKNGLGLEDDFPLRLRDDPTMVSELTGQLDEYTLGDDGAWNDERSNATQQGGFGCQMDNMLQGFLGWLMAEEEEEEEENDTRIRRKKGRR